MSLIKCPKCGEMFSDSYKTCPFCEEDEAYYSGKLRKSRGRRAAESRRRKTPSILGPVAVIVLILLAALVVYAFGWQQVIKHLPLTTAYANKAITVVWGILLGFLLFGESITLRQFIGAAVIIVGIVLFVRADNEGEGGQ